MNIERLSDKEWDKWFNDEMWSHSFNYLANGRQYGSRRVTEEKSGTKILKEISRGYVR